MATRVRTPFYREFLTPALHRRFTGAAGIALVICYVSAVLIGEKSSCETFRASVAACLELTMFPSALVVPPRADGRPDASAFDIFPFDLRAARGTASSRSKEHGVAV